MVSLGCDKNAVDADSMSQLLIDSGYEPLTESKKSAGYNRQHMRLYRFL